MAKKHMVEIDKAFIGLGATMHDLNIRLIEAAGLWDDFLKQFKTMRDRGAFNDFNS